MLSAWCLVLGILRRGARRERFRRAPRRTAECHWGLAGRPLEAAGGHAGRVPLPGLAHEALTGTAAFQVAALLATGHPAAAA